MVFFYELCDFFMNYAIFYELCDQMRFEDVNCAKSHHRVISDALIGVVSHAVGRTP